MIFKFWEEPDNRILILGKEYKLNLAFGNVMKVFELDTKDEEERIKSALFLLLGQRLGLPIEEEAKALQFIEDEYLSMREQPRYQLDAFGNVIDMDELEENSKFFDLFFDSKEIYSSFMQTYRIDLINESKSLHWYKFNALLAGLPSNTSFKQLIEIRSWKPRKGDSTEYKNQMRQLQKEVALPIQQGEGGKQEWQTDQ